MNLLFFNSKETLKNLEFWLLSPTNLSVVQKMSNTRAKIKDMLDPFHLKEALQNLEFWLISPTYVPVVQKNEQRQ